jgi:hypothetical protein
MDPIERQAVPAPAAIAERHGLTFPSIGVEVEEAVFLDEADGHGLPPLPSDSPSPFDLFADERELAAAPAPVHATVLLEPRRVDPSRPEPAPAGTDPAANRIEAPALFGRSPAATAGTVTRLMLLLLAAAAAIVLTLRACA